MPMYVQPVPGTDLLELKASGYVGRQEVGRAVEKIRELRDERKSTGLLVNASATEPYASASQASEYLEDFAHGFEADWPVAYFGTQHWPDDYREKLQKSAEHFADRVRAFSSRERALEWLMEQVEDAPNAV